MNSRKSASRLPIVSGLDPVCLVGGVRASRDIITLVSQWVGAWVAVDGGADTLLGTNWLPEAVIGDLDSLSPVARATFADRLHHISEQSTTDFEKALVRVAAPAVIAVGFTGGRMDHQLSVLSVMTQHAARRVILVDDTDVSFLALAGQTKVSLPEGTRISLMPVTPATVTLTGVQWPFADQAMQMDGFTSPSNAASGGTVTITCDAPVLATLPLACLASVLQAVVPAK